MVMSKQIFNRTHRIRHQADFDRVYRSGCYAADQVLVVYADRNDRDYCRLGLSVSRKVGGAIVRNRWKRLIREAFRGSRAALPAGLDLVVRPRRGAKADFQAILEALPRLAKQLDKKLLRLADNRSAKPS
jgi:ribonuclease P protein component